MVEYFYTIIVFYLVLIFINTEIDKLLNSTKSGSDSINFERKINAEIGEKLNEQKKGNPSLSLYYFVYI